MFMRSLRFCWVLLLGMAALGCSTPGPAPLATYELSGGIAGHAILVTVHDDGQVNVRDRMDTGSLAVSEGVLAELRRVCDQLEATGAAIEVEGEPECCDLIIEQVTYQGSVYPLADLEPALADVLRRTFEDLLERGLSASREASPESEATDA